MRALLFLLAVAVAAQPALAQEGNATDSTNATEGSGGAPAGETPAAPQPVTLTLVTAGSGGDFWWTLEGETRRNPDLVVPPGAEVTLVIKNADGNPHNFNAGTFARNRITESLGKSGNVEQVGETQTVKFTAPSTPGTLTYLCEFHVATMKGQLVIRTADAAPAPGGEDVGDINGPSVPLGQLVAAQDPCASRPVPQPVADEEIGGPTASDYLERCTNPNAATEVAEAPPHAADYVIPISWLLIGLGVVGVVWVHKWYKP